jgi:hypothetical protein
MIEDARDRSRSAPGIERVAPVLAFGTAARRRVVEFGMSVLVVTGELFRLNIEAQHLLSGVHLNFCQSV